MCCDSRFMAPVSIVYQNFCRRSKDFRGIAEQASAHLTFSSSSFTSRQQPLQSRLHCIRRCTWTCGKRAETESPVPGNRSQAINGSAKSQNPPSITTSTSAFFNAKMLFCGRNCINAPGSTLIQARGLYCTAHIATSENGLLGTEPARCREVLVWLQNKSD